MQIISDFALVVFMMAVLFSIIGGKPETVIKGSFDIVSAIIKGFFELAKAICTSIISASRSKDGRANRGSSGSRSYPSGRSSSGNRRPYPPSSGSSGTRKPYRRSRW